MTAIFAVSFAPRAEAILLQFESGPNAGQIFNSGAIEIKLSGVAAGTIYPSFGVPGTTVGVTENPGGLGVAVMNAIPGQTPPAGSTIPGEDTWGIFTVSGIFSSTDPINPIYTPNFKGSQINVIFYGAKDFFATQTSTGTQSFDSTGLMADFYQSTPGGFTIGAPTDRVGNTYPTVTAGTLILSTVSTAGFIHDVGEAGGLATTVASSFNGAAGGQGQTFLNVTGGADAAQFNTNAIASAYVPGLFADLQANFTTSTLFVPTGWLVRVNDPIAGVVIPEPATALAGIACMVPLLGSVLRRRRAVTGA